MGTHDLSMPVRHVSAFSSQQKQVEDQVCWREQAEKNHFEIFGWLLKEQSTEWRTSICPSSQTGKESIGRWGGFLLEGEYNKPDFLCLPTKQSSMLWDYQLLLLGACELKWVPRKSSLQQSTLSLSQGAMKPSNTMCLVISTFVPVRKTSDLEWRGQGNHLEPTA